MSAAAIFLVLAQIAPTPTPPRTVAGNATADLIVAKSLALGIDFAAAPGKSRASTADLQARAEAALGSWLDAQIQIPDDSIAEPPKALCDYLDERREPVWAIVGALEKGSPDWGEREGDEFWPTKVLLPTVTLEKTLLVVALREEREGDPIAASRALEAAWSLGLPVGGRGFLIDRLVSGTIERLQSGALRKLKEPTVPWMGRLAAGASWTGMLDALEREARSGSGLASDDFTKAMRRLSGAVAEHYRKLSVCDASRETDEDIWRVVSSEIEMDPNPGIRASAEPPARNERLAEGDDEQEPSAEEGEQRLYFKDLLPTVTSALRRAARLAVDKELTLRILELRLDRAASRDGKWPVKPANATSGACLEASYAYAADGEGMEIRFEGQIASPDVRLTLPLSFHTGKSAPTPKPSPASAPIPAPEAP